MKKIEIAGVPFTVVSDEEANLADMVVCARADMDSPFDDNETGVCCKCGTAIIFRPYVPKKLPRVCLTCAIVIVSATEGDAKPS